MSKTLNISISAIFLFLCAAVSGVFAQTVAPKITAVRAQLYYEEQGKFSDDLLTQKDLALWNTIIGEGSSGGASSSTFVSVEVSGRGVPVGAVKVQITATDSKKKILQSKSFDLALYDEKTKFYAPLWLYDTGCEPITITAKLIGKGASPAPIVKKIPFACGE